MPAGACAVPGGQPRTPGTAHTPPAPRANTRVLPKYGPASRRTASDRATREEKERSSTVLLAATALQKDIRGTGRPMCASLRGRMAILDRTSGSSRRQKASGASEHGRRAGPVEGERRPALSRCAGPVEGERRPAVDWMGPRGGSGGSSPRASIASRCEGGRRPPKTGRRRVATGANHPASQSSAFRRGPGTPAVVLRRGTRAPL